MHNLCVVFVERGKLTQALDCLQHAHKLAPQEDYILKHLKIVQQRLANLKQAPGMHTQKIIAFAKYDPTDFGGEATETDGDGNSDLNENIFVPSDAQQTITKPNSKEGTESEITETLTADKNDDSSTASTQQTEYIAHFGQSKTTPSSSSSSSISNNQPTTHRGNQKLSAKSTASLNTRRFIDQNDEQQFHTNHQHDKELVQDSSLPTFVHPYVHDTDDPSTGTS